jgi:hypothetical protein
VSYGNVVVIPIVLGREGIYGLRNADKVPIGAAKLLRNASLEDRTFRTEGGATSIGAAVGSIGRAAIDYWPTTSQQRTIAFFADGTIRKDNAEGTFSTTLVSGLSDSGVPMFVRGGSEALGNNPKIFMANGVDAVRVLSGDGATMSAISRPPADWSGTNQPRSLCVHAGYLWGAQGDRVYRSRLEDHEDFLTFPYQKPIEPGVGEYITAMASYKGFLVIWKYPLGVFILDTSNPSDSQWGTAQVGQAGTPGPLTWTKMENDILWVDPAAGWHLLSATEVAGSMRASDISAKKLGSFMRDRINVAQLTSGQLIYYAQKAVAMLAAHSPGSTNKSVRIGFDVLESADVGERWTYGDRDRNECLFTRKEGNFEIPAMIDQNGKLWELDRSSRNADGSAFTFLWELWDTDFEQLLGSQVAGYKTAGRFLQIEYEPRTEATHTVTVVRDGRSSQTINFSLEASPSTLPAVLPFVLSTSAPLRTPQKRLKGVAYRWSFSGFTTSSGADLALMKLLVGVEVMR